MKNTEEILSYCAAKWQTREVKNVLESNKAERHLRGGMATKEKYLRAKDTR